MIKKRFFISRFLMIPLLLLSSCGKEAPYSPINEEGEKVDTCQDSFVSIEQVREYAHQHAANTKSGVTDVSILSYGNVVDSSLLYIVNYGNGDGWQIISSDSRTPAILAEGENGTFSLEEGSPALRIWMDCMADNMAAIRSSKDEQLSFERDAIIANMDFWENSATINRIKPEENHGTWQVTTSYSEIIVEEVEHLTPHWDQDTPYNAYCPFEIGSTTYRAPAGCVAVAAAGVLYYLHKIWGIPATMVDHGYCVGDIDNYSQGFSGGSTSIWSQMNETYQFYSADAEALLIGYVGNVVGMHYSSLFGDYFSWAVPDNIRTDLFSLYGISCSQGGYDESAVKNNLERNVPVIVTASDWLIPINGNIHCFVIDGYRKTYNIITNHYYWVPDDTPYPNKPEIYEHEDYYTYSYTNPEITAIKINWGWRSQWGSSPVNDGWYSLTSDWTVTNGDTFTYNRNVNMIYDISHSN